MKSMKAKTFLLCWIPTFVVIFGMNGIFHAKIAADFFDRNLSQLQPAIHKMHDTNPLWVGLLDLMLTFGMTYFITLRQSGRIALGTAAFAGGLINLISSGAWNFANAAVFAWPVTVILGDVLWHVTLGAAGGLMIASLYNYISKRSQSQAFDHAGTSAS